MNKKTEFNGIDFGFGCNVKNVNWIDKISQIHLFQMSILSQLHQILKQILVLIHECVVEFVTIHPRDQRSKILF
jgi:hypothetical protein